MATSASFVGPKGVRNVLFCCKNFQIHFLGLSPCGNCLSVQADQLDCGTTQIEALIVKPQQSEKSTLGRVLTRRALLKCVERSIGNL